VPSSLVWSRNIPLYLKQNKLVVVYVFHFPIMKLYSKSLRIIIQRKTKIYA